MGVLLGFFRYVGASRPEEGFLPVVFLTACLLGSAAAALRSLSAIMIVAVSIPVLFALGALLSGTLSLWPLLLAIAGLNAGVMLPIGLLLVLQGRSQRLL